MSRRPAGAAVRAWEIESVIKLIRGQRVILDSDLARYYGVTTAAINQAVHRNTERFPRLRPAPTAGLPFRKATPGSGLVR
jgi:hypothetical protein